MVKGPDMDRVLRPATRVLRRFTLPTKFFFIAVVLVVPLMITLTGGFTNATEQVNATRAEQQGLAYVEPLTRLIVQIGRLHDTVLSGGDPRVVGLSAISDVDAADRELGARFGVQTEWRNVREKLAALDATAADPVLHPGGIGPVVARSTSPQQWLDQALKIRLVLGAAMDLSEEVATSSHLMLDPGVDSHHVISILVSHLPSLVDAAALAHESTTRSALLASAPTTDPSHANPNDTTPNDTTPNDTGSFSGQSAADLDRHVAEHELNVSTARLSSAMRQAWTASTDPRVRQTTQARSQTIDNAARALSASMTGDGATAPGPTPDSFTTTVNSHGPVKRLNADVALASVALSDAAQPFAQSLSATTGMLLRQRVHDLQQERLWPFGLSILAFLLAGYLCLALFRSTSLDAKAVLSEINSVAEGAIYQNEPLSGQDEFAQMSRAAVIARDRLTSLLGALRFQATHDDLTALGNRALLREKIEEVLGEFPPGHRFALAFIDLDGFADVNDSFGHDIGDQVLRTVGARFHHATRRHDVVVRIGGDDFAVLLPEVCDEHDVTDIVRRVQATLIEPIVVGGRRLRLRANAGVAIGAAGEVSAAELQRNADVAKYAAREGGTGGLAVFEPWMHERTAERAELSADFAQAIEGGQLEVLYQPIVDLRTGAVHGAEALVRWNHPTRGLIMPDAFVPLAETTGAMGSLTRWVLAQSARQLRIWRDAFADAYPLTMDVNISATQLSDDRILADLVGIIEQTGVDPSGLVLEITESALMRDVETGLRRLRQIAAIGVHLALDDFGTGYSSLAHLRRLPISVLKIDKSFVTGVRDGGSEDDLDAAMLQGIVGLGSSLGLLLVAEGIETAGQEALLREVGCHLGQGYRYSSPLSAAEFTRVMEATRHTSRWPVGDSSHGIPAQR